jgi:dTDP-glucose 4,6-dehydratase
MTKILVTGGHGTLGRPLIDCLLARGCEVWSLDIQHDSAQNYVRADIRSLMQLQRVFRTTSFDYVYHLAAEFGRLNGEEYYDTLWQTNVIGTRNILELQRKYGFRLIFASSSEIYGECEASIITEDLPMIHPVHHKNDYAMTKWVNELQIMNFAERHGNESMRLRLFNVYGPGEYYHRYRSVVCLFCYRALVGQPWDVYQGYHRVFMYIDDAIPTLANACENFVGGEVVNIGGSEYKSIEHLSGLVIRLTGASPRLARLQPRDAHNVTNKRPCIAKARRLLGHAPTVALEEGVPRTIAWMRATYALGRNKTARTL